MNLFDLAEPLSVSMVLSGIAVFYVGMVANYFLLTAPLYFYYRRQNNAVRLQPGEPFAGQVRHEIRWSMLSIALYAVLSVGLVVAWRMGAFPLFYLQPAERGWWYFGVGIVAVILLQDVCFYFSHRLLHTRKLIRFHGVHHRSRLPTPFVMYSFHPVEALTHFVRLPIMMLLIPTCPLMLIITEGFISNVVNVYSHLNHEPRWLRHLRFIHGRTSATSVYHDLHHSKVRGNYGFYLKLWDRLFGTLIPETEQRIAQVHQQWQDTPPNR